jgi:hypothetical protein
MAAPLEADVALIHVAGGDARVSPPPGTLAQTPPRRAARGRGDDMLFLTLATTSGQPGGSGPLDTLARQAAQTYYGTPGTVTAALREAAAEVNQRLLSANQRADGSTHIEGRLMAAILRGNDLYLAQSGSGQAVIIRPGQISRFTSDEAAARPLGIAVAPNVRFHHAQVGPGDILLLTASPSPPWSDPTLSGLAGLEPAQAVERLVAASGQDLTGLLIRLASPSASPARASASPPALVGPARPTGRAPIREARPGGLRRQPTPTSRSLQRAMNTLALPFQAIGRALTGAFPSLAPSPGASGMSQGLLAATAVAVPLVVVAVVTVVYLRRGRTEQYQQFLSQAQTAVVAAQLKPSLEEARPEWEAAAQWLDQALAYGNGSDAESLRQEVQQALDRLNNIARLEFAPAVGGGFGPRAGLRAVAATANDLYVYDESRPEIYHAWFTGRGYEIDREFQCLEALQPGFVPGRIIDLLVQPEPGALGTQGIVAIDAGGNLIYCAPGAAPATGLLTPPDTGWGKIQAVDLSGDKLYVLDPKANQVWIYTTADGLFVGSPALYFTEIVQGLSHAVDLAASQDELVVLHDDGLVDLCRRPQENAPDGSLRIRIECNMDLDLAPGETTLTSVIYSPPPEPSLFFLDPQGGTVVQYSMRLIYQARFIPTPGLRETPVDLAVGPPHDLFLVAGDQVFFAQPTP